MVSLAGCAVAEESPAYLMYLQGGGSVGANVSEGTMTITVKDLVPYIAIADGSRNQLVRAGNVTGFSYPFNAALVTGREKNDSTWMLAVSNLSFPDGENSLTLVAQPLQFYDGELLKAFSGENNELKTSDLEGSRTSSLYLEIKPGPKENVVGQVCPTGLVCIE
jgi:hypothetical protein